MGVLEMERVTLKQETVVAFVRNCSLYNQVCLSQHLQIAPHLVPYLFADLRGNQTARKKITTTQKNLQNQLQENAGASERRREEEELESVFLQKMQPTQGFLEALALCTYDP